MNDAVQKALAARFPGKERLVADPDAMEYVLDQGALTRQGLERSEVERTIREALLSTGVVDAVYTSRELMGPPRPGDPFFSLHQRAFFAPRSGDLVTRTKEYVYVGGRVGGTGHGTPYDYDRHIPIVFLGPGIAPGDATWTPAVPRTSPGRWGGGSGCLIRSRMPRPIWCRSCDSAARHRRLAVAAAAGAADNTRHRWPG